MTELIWDEPADRIYQSGIDRGLFAPAGFAGFSVPWSGLKSVTETIEDKVQPIYYNGQATHNVLVLGDYSATLKTFSKPDSFVEYEGYYKIRPGVYLGDQKPKLFDFSYRTAIGNPIDGTFAGYKIHVIYNVIALAGAIEANTVADSTDPVEFEWELKAIPVYFPGVEGPDMRPSAKLEIDTTKISPLILSTIETLLYTNDYGQFIWPMDSLIGILNS